MPTTLTPFQQSVVARLTKLETRVSAAEIRLADNPLARIGDGKIDVEGEWAIGRIMELSVLLCRHAFATSPTPEVSEAASEVLSLLEAMGRPH